MNKALSKWGAGNFAKWNESVGYISGSDFWLLGFRQDAPENCPVLVQCSKGSDCGFCMRCFYCKRGSFPKMTQHEFLKLIYSVPALKTKFLGIFQTMIHDSFLIPCPRFLNGVWRVNHLSLYHSAVPLRIVRATIDTSMKFKQQRNVQPYHTVVLPLCFCFNNILCLTCSIKCQIIWF